MSDVTLSSVEIPGAVLDFNDYTMKFNVIGTAPQLIPVLEGFAPLLTKVRIAWNTNTVDAVQIAKQYRTDYYTIMKPIRFLDLNSIDPQSPEASQIGKVHTDLNRLTRRMFSNLFFNTDPNDELSRLCAALATQNAVYAGQVKVYYADPIKEAYSQLGKVYKQSQEIQTKVIEAILAEGLSSPNFEDNLRELVPRLVSDRNYSPEKEQELQRKIDAYCEVQKDITTIIKGFAEKPEELRGQRLISATESLIDQTASSNDILLCLFPLGDENEGALSEADLALRRKIHDGVHTSQLNAEVTRAQLPFFIFDN